MAGGSHQLGPAAPKYSWRPASLPLGPGRGPHAPALPPAWASPALSLGTAGRTGGLCFPFGPCHRAVVKRKPIPGVGPGLHPPIPSPDSSELPGAFGVPFLFSQGGRELGGALGRSQRPPFLSHARTPPRHLEGLVCSGGRLSQGVKGSQHPKSTTVTSIQTSKAGRGGSTQLPPTAPQRRDQAVTQRLPPFLILTCSSAPSLRLSSSAPFHPRALAHARPSRWSMGPSLSHSLVSAHPCSLLHSFQEACQTALLTPTSCPSR